MKSLAPPFEPLAPPLLDRSWMLGVLLLLILAGGCSTTNWIKVRHNPNTPLAEDLELFSWRGPKPSARTMQFLRRYGLEKRLDGDSKKLLSQIETIIQDRPSEEAVYAFAELAYINGHKAEDEGNVAEAFDLFGLSVAQSYNYLLGEENVVTRNPYDPLFRRASDLYNGALESALRIVAKQGKLKPGHSQTIKLGAHDFELQVDCSGRWRPEDFEDFKFVSDYRVKGLRNHYQTYGLGVPLIAIHSHGVSDDPASEYYSPGMSFPVTAFLRVLPGSQFHTGSGRQRHFCRLELYDPLERTSIVVGNRYVPLQTDISTPLAYSLNDSTFQKANFATRGLLNPAKSQDVQGIYLLEPYDPNKIPVLMVHGLWSSLITWMEMFNDLRGVPEIRDNYQFWFYLYPTGQPFWLSASQLRSELQQIRHDIDPYYQNGNLDQMVLVGHSMGGLISRMQTLESGDDFWHLVSQQPIDSIQAPPELLNELRSALYFHPNPSIQRVVTIATPHRGSDFSNGATQWLSRKLIRLPEQMTSAVDLLLKENSALVQNAPLLKINTSVDSLSPDSPILPLMLSAAKGPHVRYHNIVGIVEKEEPGMLSRIAGESDGVVKFESARLDDAESEIAIEGDHINIHRQASAILEVQRILLAHLEELYAKRHPAREPQPNKLISRLPRLE